MRVLVIGASGFIGQQVVRRLLDHGRLDDRPLEQLVLLDLVPGPAALIRDPRVHAITADASHGAALHAALAGGIDSVFSLGATLTSDAEAHFDRGMDVNLLGAMRLLEACRGLSEQQAAPRLVFASSVAVFGGPLPDTVDDHVQLRPQTSYGTQKAVNELLIHDYSRHGFVDGRVLRLPIVVTRPGRPAGSISDRLASLIREPLRGDDTVCGLTPDTRMPLASVQAVADALLAMHDLPASTFADTRSMNLPSLSTRIDELVESVQAVARRPGWMRPLGRVRWQPDPALQAIIDAWPRRFDSTAARGLGIVGDASLDQIVDHFVRDHLDTPP